MLAILAPAPDDWFMDVFPVCPGQHQPILLPDQTCTHFETCVLIGIMKYTSLTGCIEHINRGILRHAVMHARECPFEEPIAFLITEIVVLDFSRCAFEIDQVWRIGTDQIDLRSGQQPLVGFWQSRIAADNGMPTQMPEIAGLG